MSEINITLIDRAQKEHQLLAPTDMALNLMELCKAYELPVEGVCGGMALCASCQCYIKSDHTLPEKSEDEEAMLAEAFHVQENSRLGCQIPITPNLEGLVVELAPEE
ncbi:MAG: 2Fe-2S iron-sulfur cluster-binding protein [Flavobacteriaceae bacterium]|jgi:2Fe-2S ferredoxin